MGTTPKIAQGFVRLEALGQANDVLRETLRRPLLAWPVALNALVGVGIIGMGVAAAITNPRTFSLGVGGVLIGYGTLLLVVSWAAANARRWALGLLVAASLLHTLICGNFALTSLAQRDWIPLAGSVATGLVTLAATVLSGLTVARDAARQ